LYLDWEKCFTIKKNKKGETDKYTEPGSQPAVISRGGWGKMIATCYIFQESKTFLKTSGKCNCPVAPPLVGGL